MKPVFFAFFLLIPFAGSAQPVSKKDMYADFDTLVEKIRTVSPHLQVKKDLWHYDALGEMKALRKQIDTVSSDFSFYLLIRRVLNASQDMHTSYHDFNPDEMAKVESAFHMYLPVTYVNGDYIIRESFRVGSDTVFTGTSITHINGQKVDDYIMAHITDRYYSYDLLRKKFYSAGFFKNLTTLFEDHEIFTFKDHGVSRNITIKTKEHFNYLNTASFPDTTKIEYWPEQKVLYIRLVAMDRSVLPYLLSETEKYRNYKMERIIIDIRGNGGGEDTVWQTLYSKIVAKPVSFRLKIDDYALPKEEMIARGITDQKKETNPLLLKYHLFTIVDKTETLEPLDSSIRFTGKIIVLAENIYSSAGSSIVIPNADPRDNIISIGRKAGYFLGVGFSPLNFELPHSQFPYRIAPSINVTGAVKLADLTHDRYEIELPYSIQEFIDREKYNGNIFSKGFLLHYDPFIKKALAL